MIALTFKNTIFNKCGPLGHEPRDNQWHNNQIINVPTMFSDSLQSIRIIGDDSLYKLTRRQCWRNINEVIHYNHSATSTGSEMLSKSSVDYSDRKD